MKRLVALLVASFMAVLLTACGESPAERQEQERARAAMEQQQQRDQQVHDNATHETAPRANDHTPGETVQPPAEGQ